MPKRQDSLLDDLYLIASKNEAAGFVLLGIVVAAGGWLYIAPPKAAAASTLIFHVILGVFALALLFGLLQGLRIRSQRAKLLALGIEDIDNLSGRDFERFVTAIFAKKGYKVEMTPYVGDWGADVVVSKNGERTVIQAKRWKKSVGVAAVQEVLGAKGKYKAHKMLVISNTTYTNPCLALAKANDVGLWDRDRLIVELEGLSAAKAAEHPTPPATVTPQTFQSAMPKSFSCPKCGSTMVLRTSIRGKHPGSEFWGCSNYPKCRGTRPLNP